MAIEDSGTKTLLIVYVESKIDWRRQDNKFNSEGQSECKREC